VSRILTFVLAVPLDQIWTSVTAPSSASTPNALQRSSCFTLPPNPPVILRMYGLGLPTSTSDSSLPSVFPIHVCHLGTECTEIMDNNSDNDMNMTNNPDPNGNQVSVYVARGMLIESQGPSWFYGTGSEHSTLYQYQLNKANNVSCELFSLLA
jgi:hypothetical protein